MLQQEAEEKQRHSNIMIRGRENRENQTGTLWALYAKRVTDEKETTGIKKKT